MVERRVSLKSNLDGKTDISVKEVIFKVQDWYNYFLSKWKITLLSIIIGGLLGFIYASFSKRLYTAETTFVLEEGGGIGGGMLGQYAGVAAMVGIDMGGGGGLFQGDNIIELYKSRTMIQKALLTSIDFSDKRQLLIDRYLEFNGIRKGWEDSPIKSLSFTDTSKFTIQHDSIMGKIVKDINKKYLTIERPDKKLSIIKVRVKAEDEEFSKRFNDALVETVNKFYIDTKTKKSKETLNILQHQTDSVRAVMNGAIFSSATTIDATPNLNSTRQVLRIPVQRAQINAETNKAMLMELVKNLELSRMALRKDQPLLQIVDKPIYPLEFSKLRKIHSTLIGGMLMGFLTVLFFFIKRLYVQVIHEN